MSLVNRRIHSLGERRISKHRMMKQRYYRIENQPMDIVKSIARHERTKVKFPTRSLVAAITEICKNRSAAHYVEEIVVHDIRNRWYNFTPYQNEERARRKLTESCSDLLCSIAQRNRNMQLGIHGRLLFTFDFEWQTKFGSEDGLLALLLTLVPNVRTIRFGPYRMEPSMTLDVAQIIAQTYSSKFLTKLSKIVVAAQHGDWDLAPLYSFAKIPSLRTIIATDISESVTPFMLPLPLADVHKRVSNVTELALFRANLHSISVQCLICVCKGLQRFTYEPCDALDSNREYYIFEPGFIRNYLLEYAQRSLKVLVIHARCRERKYIGCLKEFEALSELETDWGLLRDNTKPARNQLTHVLPRSIKRVLLMPDPGLPVDVSVDAINQLKARKRQHFPKLEELQLKHTTLVEPTRTRLIFKARKQGLCIVFDQTANPDTKRKTYLEQR